MVIGSMLSITLPGCASRVEHRPAEIVAVKVQTKPPAELLACPAQVPAFPVDQAATIPPEVRAAIMALALGYRGNADQLLRLIRYADPLACPDRPSQ